MIHIIYKNDCQKLSQLAQGLIGYEWGVDEEKSYHVRLVSNQSSGMFSQEWVKYDLIDQLLKQQTLPFKATVFKELFIRRSANNHGFLTAVLRAEGRIKGIVEYPTMNANATDLNLLKKLKGLAEKKEYLPDLIAEQAEQKAIEKAKRIEQMRLNHANAKDAKAVKDEEEAITQNEPLA